MSMLSQLVLAVSRRTLRAEGHIFAMTPERLALGEGLRAILVVGPVLAAVVFFDRPGLAIGVLAAFWGCLCDPQGARGQRFRTLGELAVLGTLIVSLASYGAYWGYGASLATLFILVFLGGLTRSYQPSLGPAPAQVGVIAQIAAVIGISAGRPFAEALEMGGYFMLGSVWAMLFCVLIYPIPLNQSAQLTLTTIFGRLEDFASYVETMDFRDGKDAGEWLDRDTAYRRGMRMSLERGRMLAALDAADNLRIGASINAAGRVFSALIAIGHSRRNAGAATDERSQALLTGLRKLMHSLYSAAQQDAVMPRSVIAQAQLLADEAAGRDDQLGRAVIFAANAIARLAHDEQTLAAPAPMSADPPKARGFRIEALVWRHALRVATAAVCAFAVGTAVNIEFAYWGAVAAVIVTLPISSNTWLRVMERACGSLIGAVAAVLLLYSDVPEWYAVLPLAAAAIALRLVNYGLFVVFLTPMFLLITDFTRHTEGLIGIRFINELVGACIGVAATLFLWPEKESDALGSAVDHAVSANMKFAAAALRMGQGAAADLDRLQVAAGLASTRLEAARERMLLEGRWRSTHLNDLKELISALRTICGAAAVVEVLREGEPDAHELQRADDYDAITARVLSAPDFVQAGASSTDDLDDAVRHFLAAYAAYQRSQQLR